MISPSKPTTQRLRLDRIRLDGDTQPREELDPNHIEDLKADAQAGDTFPPLDVFFDGREYWLADGFHRWHTYHRLEVGTAEVKIHAGNIQAAQWFALSKANRTHGKRRTREDKVRAVRLALLHPNAAGRSDRDLAADLGVHHETVAKYRAELEAGGEIATSRTRTGRDGKSYPAPKPKTGPEPTDKPPMPPNPFEDDPESETTKPEKSTAPKRGSDGRRIPKQAATEAMQFAAMAISQLERIRPDDPNRDEALARVEKWIRNARIPTDASDTVANDVPSKKALAAYGRLVRALYDLGLFDHLHDALEQIQASLSKVRPPAVAPEPERITDGRGRPVPPRFHEVFARATKYDAAMALRAIAP
jgi:hypothetical protein